MPPSMPHDLGDLLDQSRWVEELALRLVGDPAVAADLSQEAMVAALRRRPARGADLRPWLAGVVRKLALRWRRDESRMRAKHHDGVREEPLPSTDELVEQAELRRWVAEEVERLPEPGRTTVLLRYFRGLSAAEIARRQGVPGGTVRARLKRAMDELRSRLDARAGGQRGRWAAVALSLAPSAPLPPAPAGGGTVERALPLLEISMAAKGALLATGAVAVAATIAVGTWWTGDAPRAALPGMPERPAEMAGPGELPPAPARAEAPVPPEQSSATQRAVASAPPEPLPAAEPAPPRPARVRAVVVDGDGRGLAGAFLRAVDTGERATSAAGGAVELALALEGDRPRPVDFEVRAPDLATRYVRAQLFPGEETHLGRIALGEAGAVSGRVVSERGEPLEDAHVFVTPPAGWSNSPEEVRRHGPDLEVALLETQSGAGGHFRLEGIEVGHHRVWGHAAGRAYVSTEPIEVRAGDEIAGLEVVVPLLVDDDRIAGIVLTPLGEPVPGAFVGYRYRHAGGATSTGLQTDASGRFSIVVEHRVPHGFQVSDERWTAILRPDVAPGTLDLELCFEETAPLVVRAVDSGGRPVERLGVKLEANPGEMLGMQISPLETLALGEHPEGARLRTPTVPFDVVVDAPGYELARLGPFDPASVGAELEVELEALPGIHGVVLAAGEPVAGAKVGLRAPVGDDSIVLHDGYRTLFRQVSGSEVETDGEGRFTLHLRGRGSYRLRAEKDGFAVAETPPLDLDGGTGAEGLEIHLGPGGAIEGRVLVPPGDGAAGRVVAINRGDGEPRTRRVDAGGAFRFERLTPGDWQVLAVEDEIDLHRNSVSMATVPDAPPVEWSCTVRDGETTRFDLDLRGQEVVALRGRLVLDGSAAGWTAALLRDADDWMNDSAVDATALDADGRFELRAASEGPLRLELAAPGEAFVVVEPEVDLRDGERDWELELPLGRIAGSFADPPPDATLPLEIRWSFAGRDAFARAIVAVDQGGGFALDPAPAGEGTVRCWRTDSQGPGRWEELGRVVVPEGGEGRIDL